MAPPAGARAAAVRFILLLGVVSLFADMTYEGARSITGPYLGLLGASAAAIGVVAGAGEFIGYGLRLLFGFVSDRTRRYWTLIVAGYAVNLLAVPLLAFAGRWEIAALLIILERSGKAVRAPARDVVLSNAARAVGTGWGFGLHEALDQIGALAGPLIVALIIAEGGGYRLAFLVLLAPAIAALAVLIAARFRYSRPAELERKTPEVRTSGLTRPFWLYLTAAGLMAAGFADFPLIAFHFGNAGVAPGAWIPLLYALAMGVDAVAALGFGRLFDRWGIPSLILAAILSAAAAPLLFLGGARAAVAGVVLWGIGLGAQESVMRAAVADLVPAERRGAAYGIFNTGYGLLWFLGSAAMGMLYGGSPGWLATFAAAAQLAAVPLLLAAGRALTRARRTPGTGGTATRRPRDA
jgi:MFS family permease